MPTIEINAGEAVLLILSALWVLALAYTVGFRCGESHAIGALRSVRRLQGKHEGSEEPQAPVR